MKLTIILLLTAALASAQVNNNNNPAKENTHNLKLLQPNINFFAPTSGFYQYIPSLLGDKPLYISANITNLGNLPETNAFLKVDIEELSTNEIITSYSDTISEILPGDTTLITLQAIDLTNLSSIEIRISLQYDSLVFDIQPNQGDTLESFDTGCCYAKYLRTQLVDTNICIETYPPDSDGKFLIGNQLYIPETISLEGCYFYVGALPESLGSTLIGYIYNQNDELVAESEEYDIMNSWGLEWIEIPINYFPYLSLEGGKMYKFVITFYSGEDYFFLAAYSENTHGILNYSIFGEKSADSIIWSPINLVPSVGLIFYPYSSVEQLPTQQLSIFPNPTSNYLQIELASQDQLSIINMQGIVVYKQSFPPGKQKIPVNSLAPGTYLLHSNNSGLNTKFVIK